MTRLIVTGTDTGVGKTAAAAMLTLALDAHYWKPLQSGLPTDRETVARLTGLPASRFIPENYVFSNPLSPHRAAELDGVTVAPETIVPPKIDGALVIEGAGGLLVPVTRELLQIDLFARWNAPLVLCARTALGTINHTLLSLEAIKHRDVNLAGVLFIGDANEDSENTITAFGKVKRLGRLPLLQTLSRETLARAFAENFRISDFGTRDA